MSTSNLGPAVTNSANYQALTADSATANPSPLTVQAIQSQAGSAAVAAALGKSLYLGLVASRTGASGAFTGVNKNWKMSTLHTATVPIAAMKVRDSNWWLSSGVETATGSTMQVKRWVEYPIGSTPQPLPYSGAAVGTCLSGRSEERRVGKECRL